MDDSSKLCFSQFHFYCPITNSHLFYYCPQHLPWLWLSWYSTRKHKDAPHSPPSIPIGLPLSWSYNTSFPTPYLWLAVLLVLSRWCWRHCLPDTCSPQHGSPVAPLASTHSHRMSRQSVPTHCLETYNQVVQIQLYQWYNNIIGRHLFRCDKKKRTRRFPNQKCKACSKNISQLVNSVLIFKLHQWLCNTYHS
jgi:hypothetical protein